MKNDRIKAYRKGRRAERLAALFLQLKGYRIAARRFKTPVGEVDLIARKGDLIVFVEVKARANPQIALDSVSHNAQRRIESASSWWLARQHDTASLNWRFDVVAIVPRRWPSHFEEVW
jgi:putative endonuclease